MIGFQSCSCFLSILSRSQTGACSLYPVGRATYTASESLRGRLSRHRHRVFVSSTALRRISAEEIHDAVTKSLLMLAILPTVTHSLLKTVVGLNSTCHAATRHPEPCRGDQAQLRNHIATRSNAGRADLISTIVSTCTPREQA